MTDKPGLLLHICCAGCGAYVAELLNEIYSVKLFFFNPNIFPLEEYEIRRQEVEKIADRLELPAIFGEYDHEAWLAAVSGREQEPEKGRRCQICYALRMFETARQAKQAGCGFFTVTLSVSPHKDAQAISRIGQQLAADQGLKFLDQDFKKNDGFKLAVARSKEWGLYRQNYCGCEFSRKM